MLSKSIGLASAWSAKVAPCRRTITRPPARKACARSLSSAIAGRGPTPPNRVHRPAAKARAEKLRRDALSISDFPFLHQEHALAGGLGIKQLVGLFGLIQFPAVG